VAIAGDWLLVVGSDAETRALAEFAKAHPLPVKEAS
jgi:hypothetical protein